MREGGVVYELVWGIVFSGVLVLGIMGVIYASTREMTRVTIQDGPPDPALDHLDTWNGIPHISMAVAKSDVHRIVFTERTLSNQSGLTPRIFYTGDEQVPARVRYEFGGRDHGVHWYIWFNQTVFVDSDGGPVVATLPDNYVVPHTAVLVVNPSKTTPLSAGYMLLIAGVLCLAVPIFFCISLCTWLSSVAVFFWTLHHVALWIDGLVTPYFSIVPPASLHN